MNNLSDSKKLQKVNKEQLRYIGSSFIRSVIFLHRLKRHKIKKYICSQYLTYYLSYFNKDIYSFLNSKPYTVAIEYDELNKTLEKLFYSGIINKTEWKMLKQSTYAIKKLRIKYNLIYIFL